ncbi:type II restriction endonuclease [Synechococcus phage DSL-LC03]|nr:type II restriction endonuclease [Synechococcus phage DSL-LC03]
MTELLIEAILHPIKQKTVMKIYKNLHANGELNLIKDAIPEVLIWATFEKTFTTCLGYALQEIAETCGNNVRNTDKKQRKVLGIDLAINEEWEGQLKANKNTQTGTHKNDSIQKLLETTSQHETKAFFAVAFGDSFDYVKDDIRYIGGEAFWTWIGIDYTQLRDIIVRVMRETADEVKHAYGYVLR